MSRDPEDGDERTAVDPEDGRIDDESEDGFRFDADSGFDSDSGFDPENTENTESADADDGADGSSSTDRIRAALDEVRGEVRKAALLHSAVEAALVALLANLALALVEPAALAWTVGLPGVVAEALRGLPLAGDVAPRTLGATSLVAVALGGVAFAAAYLLRMRRPLVERFEAANPPVREALRTARDAVDDGADTEMARRLYDDVVDTLGETSGLELVETRRVAVTALLVVLVSLASVQVAVVNPDLAGLLGGNSGGAGIEQPDDDDLRDGDEILGEDEDVSAGDDLENISAPGTGEGSGDGPTGPSDGLGGGGGDGEFDGQQAGFAGEERIEDAELVREYNLRIREFDGESDGAGGDDSNAQ